jgi:hypothetical protein
MVASWAVQHYQIVKLNGGTKRAYDALADHQGTIVYDPKCPAHMAATTATQTPSRIPATPTTLIPGHSKDYAMNRTGSGTPVVTMAPAAGGGVADHTDHLAAALYTIVNSPQEAFQSLGLRLVEEAQAEGRWNTERTRVAQLLQVTYSSLQSM